MKFSKNKILLICFFLIMITGIYIMTAENNTKIKLETNHGDIVIELYSNSPVTAGNFKSLVEKGTYNGVIFHRIIGNFMIQGGDPTGTGFGDPKIPSIDDEFIKGNSNLRGTISMANSGPNTGSSQFFINLVDNTFLDWDKEPIQSKHPVFGKVVEGMDVVDEIAKVQVDYQDRPIEEVKIIKASVLE
jgi:peptidylprolyl isomerase